MERKTKLFFVFLIILAGSFFTGCGGGGGSSSGGGDCECGSDARTTLQDFLLPSASGAAVYGSGAASIDASSPSEGYVMVQYSGAADKAKVQITDPSGTVYTYTMFGGPYEAFPLSGGSGSYHIDVLEHVSGDLYAVVTAQDIYAELTDEFKPFLYPNQYSWFTADSKAAALGVELSGKSCCDLNYVQNVYHEVTKSIKYDEALAENIPVDYIPDIDATIASGKGICFDYAALMTALLRSQGIPTKLEVGYSGTAYHAWISVHLDETGWVDGIIEFDGQNWSLMDPTLAANNNSSSVEKYIGDGSNYTVKYHY